MNASENVRIVWADFNRGSVTFLLDAGTTSDVDVSRLNTVERNRLWSEFVDVKRVLSQVTISQQSGT